MSDWSVLQFFLVGIGFYILSYVWVRLMSLAVFNSFAQMFGSPMCLSCAFYRERYIKRMEEEHEKEKEAEKEIRCQEQE